MAHQPIPVATAAQSCPGNQKLCFKPTLASEPNPSRVAKAGPCGRTTGLAGRWSSIAADSWPQTTSTADDMLFGPLLQVKQEKAAEKHNQKDQIQTPIRGSTQHHILIRLFREMIKETCGKCTGYSFKLRAYDSSKYKNPITVSLHASPPN